MVRRNGEAVTWNYICGYIFCICTHFSQDNNFTATQYVLIFHSIDGHLSSGECLQSTNILHFFKQTDEKQLTLPASENAQSPAPASLMSPPIITRTAATPQGSPMCEQPKEFKGPFLDTQSIDSDSQSLVSNDLILVILSYLATFLL